MSTPVNTVAPPYNIIYNFFRDFQYHFHLFSCPSEATRWNGGNPALEGLPPTPSSLNRWHVSSTSNKLVYAIDAGYTFEAIYLDNKGCSVPHTM